MRTPVALLLACVFLSSCGPKATQQPLLIEDGKGIAGMCQLGDKPSAIRRGFTIDHMETTFREKGIVRVREYACGSILFETIDIGEGERVARISVICFSTNSHLSGVQTKRGLELLPTPPTREQVVAAYGKPVREYGWHHSLAIVDDIRRGIAYVVPEKPDFPEFLHYPAEGLSFVIHDGKVIKCSVQQPYFRPLWEY